MSLRSSGAQATIPEQDIPKYSAHHAELVEALQCAVLAFEVAEIADPACIDIDALASRIRDLLAKIGGDQ